MKSQDGFLSQFIEKRWYLLLLALALTGLSASLSAVLFRSGVHRLEELRLSLLSLIPPLVALPVLGAVGGLISGLLVSRIAPAAGGSGVSHLIGFLHNRPIPINIKVALVKLIAGITAIGSGFPLGAEGPSVQMGGAVAWQISKWIKAPKSFTKIIVSAGGGAGLAAVFNAPIAGLFFAIEELLHTTTPLVMGVVAVTAFWSDAWGAIFNWLGVDKENGGFHGVYGFQIYSEHDVDVSFLPIDIIGLVFLGFAIGLVGELYTRYLLNAGRLSSQLFKQRLVLKMVLSGLSIGIIYALLPEIFHEFTELDNLVIDAVASPSLALQTLLVMFATTGLAVASGAPGGLFMPMLTLGACSGLAICGFYETVFGYAPSSMIYAGMGAFVAACSRTPITAIFIVFAITKNLLILKPVLIASIASYLTSRAISNKSIYERQLDSRLQGEL